MPKLPPTISRSAVLQAIRSPDRGPEVVEYNRYVTDHIRSTGRSVQAAEIASALMLLAAGWLGFLLAAALVEHWLTERGFPDAVRYLLFAVAAGATGWFVVRRLGPLVTRRINPLYTAKSIEQSAPSLKNSLINLLTLRGGERPLPPAVLATLEQHAAEGILRAPEEAVVDRSRVVRLAAVMVGLLSAVSLYALFSTKDPFVTAARIVAPWARIAPPSRVRITDVTPGDATLVEGQTLELAARVAGLRPDEGVEAVITSADGQRVEERLDLRLDPDLNRYVLCLPTLPEPGSKAAFTGRVRYRVEAGDGRSPTYAVDIRPAPALVLTRVDYRFPEYTGLVDHTQENSGDLRGIERTRVTLHAKANTAIDAAYVDFESDGSRDLDMRVDGDTATVSFELALRDDRRTPKFGGYALRLKTADGLTNEVPARHNIDVYPDYPPEAELTAPEEPERVVRLNETVAIRGTARDPDFALSDVRVFAEREGELVLHKRLLTRPARGRYDAEFDFTPTRLGLQAGDVVDYWLEATDDRDPDPQTVVTRRQTFRVASPDAAGEPSRNETADAGDQQGQPNGDENQQGDGDQGDAGQQQGDQRGDRGENGAERDGGPEGQAGDQSEQGSPDQNGDSGQSQGNNAQQPQDGQNEGDQAERGGGMQSDQPGESQESDESQQGQSTDAATDSNQTSGESGGQGAGAGNDSNDGAQSSPDGGQRGEGGRQTGARRKPGDNPSGDNASDGGASDEQQPVDSSGANDGEAFDRILDHMAKQDPQGDPKPDGQPGDNEKEGQNQDGQGQPSSPSESQDGQRDPAQQDHPADEGQSNDRSQGAGADASGGDTAGGDRQQRQERDAQPGQDQETQGGQQQSPKGDPSESNSDGQSKGSPSTDQQRRPTDKPQQDPSGDARENTDEAQSPSESKQESDSDSDTAGEQSGAGEEGGGQRSDQQGAGSSGQNQAADEGAGRAGEEGQGDTGDRGGQDEPADSPTGQQGRDPGEGSTDRSGRGDQPGGDQSPEGQSPEGQSPGEQSPEDQSPNGQSPEGQSPNEQQGEQPDGSRQDDNTSRDGADNANRDRANGDQQQPSDPSDQQPGGEGARGGTPQPGESGAQPDGGANNNRTAPPTAGGDPGGDAANLDYAREQTDLVLERLSEQLKDQEVDPELLDKLGWTEDELRRFVDRWNARKQAARQASNNQAQAVLDDALRAIGLKPRELSGQTDRAADELRNQASARTSPPPPKFRDKLRNFNQGVSGAAE